MDRRQRKTRTAIYNAFASLLEEKTYSNITVQDIINRADIGRSTFYSHFETKDELMKLMCEDIFEHVFGDHLSKEDTHDFSEEKKDIKAEITHVLYHLRDSNKNFRRILAGESGDTFMWYFKSYLSPVFEGELKKTYLNVPKDYALNHMVCDFAETVRWWMNHENYTPEEICDFFFNTSPFIKLE